VPPVAPVHSHTHGGHNLGRVNPKDIRETELYQENYNGERVFEGGSLAGMPLDRLNRPLASLAGANEVIAPNIITESAPILQSSSVGTCIVENVPGLTTTSTSLAQPLVTEAAQIISGGDQPMHRTNIEHFG
jgi:hypothetical protein